MGERGEEERALAPRAHLISLACKYDEDLLRSIVGAILRNAQSSK